VFNFRDLFKKQETTTEVEFDYLTMEITNLINTKLDEINKKIKNQSAIINTLNDNQNAIVRDINQKASSLDRQLTLNTYTKVNDYLQFLGIITNISHISNKEKSTALRIINKGIKQLKYEMCLFNLSYESDYIKEISLNQDIEDYSVFDTGLMFMKKQKASGDKQDALGDEK
jgi:hypothetical protein